MRKVDDKNSTCTLIVQTATEDSEGFKSFSEQSKEVWCSIESITQHEFFEAGRDDIRAEYKVTLNVDDYDGQRIVEIDGSRYAVYRTYRPGADDIELYLEDKAGLNGTV